MLVNSEGDEQKLEQRVKLRHSISLPPDDTDISLAWLSEYEWLVVREASRFFNSFPACRDDLLQECRIALLRAGEMYDSERGTPFIPYAARVISRAAQKFVIQESRRGFSGVLPSRPYTAPKVMSVAPDSGGTKPQIELIADDYKFPIHWTANHWSRVFRCLSDSQLMVLRLRLFKDLSNREVGELMGFRESRASFLWQQALQRLRENQIAIEDV
jgi:RNA polymerase sigma factor (sigma-70 family)